MIGVRGAGANNEQTNKQRWLQHAASRLPTAASASWPRCTTRAEPYPGPWCSTSPAKCQRRVPPGRKWGAPDRRQGPAGALPCRAPCLPGPSSAKAGPGSAGPGRCLGREVPAGRPVPSCDLDGQVQPAATLLRRWRWISDHRHTIILLPSPYSDKVLRSLSLTAGSSAG